MKIPDRIKIGGRVYAVELTPRPCLNSTETDGEIIYDMGTVKIGNTTQAKDYQEEVFLHECLHGMFQFMSREQNEELITDLAKHLHAFIVDNPEVFK